MVIFGDESVVWVNWIVLVILVFVVFFIWGVFIGFKLILIYVFGFYMGMIGFIYMVENVVGVMDSVIVMLVVYKFGEDVELLEFVFSDGFV